jgi:colicin import membrane protein
VPRDNYNIIPVILAGVLHAGILAAMIFAFDFSRPMNPRIPLAIKGTLVSEDEIRMPPPPEPVPVPEPEPDNSEQLRKEAEELKRQEDARKERERISRLKKQQEQETAEKNRREELELERRRAEAERKRLEDVERQRAENERKRQEAEEAERQRLQAREIAEEQARIDAMNSGASARYVYAIQRAIQSNWFEPASAVAGLECVVNVRQLPGGEVLGATIGQCNGDDAVKRSIIAAVIKASPLPEPEDPTLFERNLRITFKPEQ